MNGGVNNREAGDLKRYRAHYDVTVMSSGIGNGSGSVIESVSNNGSCSSSRSSEYNNGKSSDGSTMDTLVHIVQQQNKLTSLIYDIQFDR